MTTVPMIVVYCDDDDDDDVVDSGDDDEWMRAIMMMSIMSTKKWLITCRKVVNSITFLFQKYKGKLSNSTV